MPYRDRDAESFFAQAAKDSKTQELPPIPNSLLRRDPDPPTEGYLETRARLGFPTRSPFIVVACPWCGAGVLQQCINVGTGRETSPHQARKDAAK